MAAESLFFSIRAVRCVRGQAKIQQQLSCFITTVVNNICCVSGVTVAHAIKFLLKIVIEHIKFRCVSFLISSPETWPGFLCVVPCWSTRWSSRTTVQFSFFQSDSFPFKNRVFRPSSARSLLLHIQLLSTAVFRHYITHQPPVSAATHRSGPEPFPHTCLSPPIALLTAGALCRPLNVDSVIYVHSC